MLKVGVVGVGGISKAHIAAWADMADVQLAAICDIRPERMEAYPDLSHYTSFEAMLAAETLDIVDICLPTYLHTEYAVKTLEQGIHVLCEKPISLRREDVRRIYDAAERNHVCFMVAQVLRFWPEYELLKELYDSGRYGKLLSGSMTRLGHLPEWSWDNWMMDENRSGMVPFDLHIHDLDFMIYAFGTPKNKTVFRAKRPDQDYINAVYEYDGFFITTEASWYASPYPFSGKFRFQFEEAVVANEGGGMKIYERSGAVLDLAVEEGKDTGEIHLPKSNAYANEIRYFADCVKRGIPADKVKPEQLETVIDILRSL